MKPQMTCPVRPPQCRGELSQRGFTLVELMISLVLGLFIVLALVTLLINVNRNNSELTKTNGVIESGRFASQLLQADLSHAGFWARYVPQWDDLTFKNAPTLPTTIAGFDPCASLATWDANYKLNLIAHPVQAYQFASPAVALSICSGKMANPQPNTDVLFVRHAAPCVASATATDDDCKDATGNVYFQVPDCTTTTSPGYSASTYVFGTDTFTLRKRDCTAAAAGTLENKYKYVSNFYYVRNYATNVGDGLPTLMRAQFRCTLDAPGTSCTSPPQFQPADALVEGIEGFRVEFGADSVSDSGATLTAADFSNSITWANSSNLTSPTNRGDGLPDGAYIRGPSATEFQLMNTVAVKVYYLVRSENKTAGYTDSKVYCLGSSCPAATSTTCPVGTANTQPLLGPFCDGYKRHLFSQTIRLTNVSMRRETP
jgi:type IV pilus assembly protein PilW